MRVIVTRPERDAPEWVQGLRSAGLEVAQLPLIAIGPVTDVTALRNTWQNLHHYSAVMFVSGNAVEQFFKSKPKKASVSIDLFATKTRVWATGPGTTRALLQAGVDPRTLDAPAMDAGQFDSEALWCVVSASVKPGDRVLILRGAYSLGTGAQASTGGASTAGMATAATASVVVSTSGTGRNWLASRLTEAGAQVDFVVVYQRCVPLFSEADRILAHTAATDSSVWLLSSSEAVANLEVLMDGQSWTHARAVATHPRIAERARQLGFGVVCESRPIISSVVASIESMG